MPVTIQIASVVADERFRRPTGETPTAEQVLNSVWKAKGVECKELLQSSYEPVKDYTANSNAFVRAVILAYNTHQHLIIRPDDVWIAILSQLNLYVNAHAEEMRPFFVQHEGQKELVVTGVGSRYTVDFGKLTQAMSEELKKNINDPSLHDFIMPNFTTTTENDKVICSVMMMSTLKSYFTYKKRLLCGIPSITLLGEKSDYESLVARLDKLATLGREPHTVARLLRPVLTHFVNVFDTPPVMDFWSKICHSKSRGSGGRDIGGWISAFSMWDSEGKWMGTNIELIDAPLTEEEKEYAIKYEEYAIKYEAMRSQRALEDLWMLGLDFQRLPVLILDGLRYPVVDTADIPDGFSQVDVKLDDNGVEFECMMVAGHVGYALLDDLKPDVDSGVVKRNTLQPLPQWFLFIKGEKAEEPQNWSRRPTRHPGIATGTSHKGEAPNSQHVKLVASSLIIIATLILCSSFGKAILRLLSRPSPRLKS